MNEKGEAKECIVRGIERSAGGKGEGEEECRNRARGKEETEVRVMCIDGLWTGGEKGLIKQREREEKKSV